MNEEIINQDKQIGISNKPPEAPTELNSFSVKDDVQQMVIDRHKDVLTAITNIAAELIGTLDFDLAMNKSLAKLGTMTSASRAYLFMIDEDGTRLSNTHEWCAEGITPEIQSLQNLPAERFPWWMEKLIKREIIHISDVSKMPEDARTTQEILEAQDIKSLIVFPIFVKEKLTGFFGLDNVKSTGLWPNSTILLMHLVSQIIGSTFERVRMDEKLVIKDKAIASSINAVVFSDMAGNITYVNNSFIKMWGYAEESEVIGKPVVNFWKSELEAMEIVKLLHERKNWIGNLVATRKDGSNFDVQISASEVVDDRGKAICMMGSFVDITSQQRAEQAVRESQEKLYSMFQSVTDAIVVTDMDGIITELNERAAELHGYDSEAELIGKHGLELMAANEHENARSNILKIIKEGSVRDTQHTLVRKDGSEFLGEMSASLLKGPDGNPIGIIIISRDITERKRIENELMQIATHDHMTGILNRLSGMLLFRQQLQFARRNNQKLTVCYIDVDYLKVINDVYGHAEGDEVLKTVGNIIKGTLRKVDIFCRMGGDEFLIVLPNCIKQQAIHMWERINEKTSDFNARKTKPYSLSLSRGFAEYDPATEQSAEQLIMIADQEMYVHKRSKYSK